ncbi:NAD(P)/FAD-dependent oxidoreductase [Mycobacteroides abscessus subsp. bolletii]|nr:NAD(P)/FAD-dependent oxidoreductase [Mycobacteroides abscessus subsp. bolletii]
MSTAAYLAANGQRVLVLERYNMVGGSTHMFRRRGKWEFEVGVHYIEDCGPGGLMPRILGGIGLADRVEFLQMDPEGWDTIVAPDFELRTPVGWDNYRDNLAAAFPGEIKAVDRYVKLLRKVNPAGERTHPDFGTVKRFAAAGLAAPLIMTPLVGVLLSCGFSLRAVFALSAQTGAYCTNPDVAAFGWHAAYAGMAIGSTGAWYPRGGGQVLSSNLLQFFTAHRGELRTDSTVEKILIEGSRAVGVRLRGGEEIRAEAVVSDADIKHTLLDLVGPENLPRRGALRARALTMGQPLFNTYFGIELDLRGTPNTNYFAIPSWEPAKNIGRLGAFGTRMLRNGFQGDRSKWLNSFSSSMPGFIHSATIRDPENPRTSPAGHTSFEVMTMVPSNPTMWDVNDSDPDDHSYRKSPIYREMKERMTDAMLDRIEQVYPGARAKTVWSEAASPATQTRYARNTNGACFGLGVTPAQYGPTRPGTKTVIGRLFLAGTSTRWGSGTTGSMLSGVHAAGAVLGRDLVGEVIREGAVYGDASLLGPNDSYWDAVAAARHRGSMVATGATVSDDEDADPIEIDLSSQSWQSGSAAAP